MSDNVPTAPKKIFQILNQVNQVFFLNSSNFSFSHKQTLLKLSYGFLKIILEILDIPSEIR